MSPDEVDTYMNELLEKGAYRVDGMDPDTGDLMLAVVPDVMQQVDPALFEIYELEARAELEETLIALEEKGLIIRDEDGENFEIDIDGLTAYVNNGE